MLSPEIKTAAGSWMNLVFVHSNTSIYIIFTGQAGQPKNTTNSCRIFLLKQSGNIRPQQRQLIK